MITEKFIQSEIMRLSKKYHTPVYSLDRNKIGNQWGTISYRNFGQPKNRYSWDHGSRLLTPTYPLSDICVAIQKELCAITRLVVVYHEFGHVQCFRNSCDCKICDWSWKQHDRSRQELHAFRFAIKTSVKLGIYPVRQKIICHLKRLTKVDNLVYADTAKKLLAELEII